jgi:hypothetical protein
VAESDRREPAISSVTGRQLGFLPNMIQPPLLGVVNAASAVSARALTCRAPAVPRSCSMLSVYMAVRVHPFPKIAAARRERVRSLDLDIARVVREGIAAFDAVPLEGLAPTLPSPASEGGLGRGVHSRRRVEYINVLGPSRAPSYILPAARSSCGGLFKIKPATDRQVGHRSLRNRRYRA